MVIYIMFVLEILALEFLYRNLAPPKKKNLEIAHQMSTIITQLPLYLALLETKYFI